MSIPLNPSTGVGSAVTLASRTASGEEVQDVFPRAVSGGFWELATANNAYATLPSQACASATVVNATAVNILVRRGGAGSALILAPGMAVPVDGLTNLNQLEIRRQDTSAISVTITGTWVA